MGLNTEQIVKILQLKGLGRRTASKLYTATEKEIVNNDQELQELILSYIVAKKINLPPYSKSDFIEAFKKGEKIIETSKKNDITILSCFDNDFPDQLKYIEDYPMLLNFKGDFKRLNDLIGIAIIGTREPTPEGIKSGEFFGEFFGQNKFNVVSGLAKGCDSAAHRGCLKAKGFTTAILAHGLQMIYPKENKKLAEDIISSGGVILSEYLIGTKPLANYFVERDRLQAGLSNATVVIQSGIKGGTHYAVKATISSQKLLAAVRYKQNIESDKVKGNELFIHKDKAFPLTSENKQEFLDKILRTVTGTDLIKFEKEAPIETLNTEYKKEELVESLDTKHEKKTKEASVGASDKESPKEALVETTATELKKETSVEILNMESKEVSINTQSKIQQSFETECQPKIKPLTERKRINKKKSNKNNPKLL